MEDNECVIESKIIEIAIFINTFISSLRIRKIKSLLFAVDNFWLYEYHKENYTWLTNNIFGTIRFIESKKSQIIDPEDLPFIEDSIVPTFPNYYPYSNEKYIQVEGKDSFFFRSTLEYFIMGLPYVIVLFFVCNRIFYCLFEREISQHLRIFSFWGFLFQMGIESNIEFFTFLAFRNFHTMFSFDFSNKLYLAAMIFFVYFVVLFAVAGYFLMYYLYGKLAKYFLDNLYRIRGSFFMMTFIYGLRPFFKGVIHS